MTTRLSNTNRGTKNNNEVNVIISKPLASKATHCCYCTLEFKGPFRIGCPINRSYSFVNNIENDKHYDIIGTDNYDTIGIFCSYSCAKAFAKSNLSADPIFSKSENLLAKMYARQYGLYDPVTLISSPSPLLLTKYGGNVSEEQYENEKGKVSYELEGQIISSNPVASIYIKS